MTATTVDEVLVVREGAARLRWTRRGAGWQLTGRWPELAESAALAEHLDAGRPVLVLLEVRTEPVYATGDELAQAPAELCTAKSDAEQPLQEVGIPVLDWLVEPHRRRGLAFLDQVRVLVAGTPVALLPEVIVDDAVVHGGQVRFACRTSAHASGVDEVKMRAVAAHVFGRSPEADRP